MVKQENKILIIVPVYNEQDNIDFVINDLKENTKEDILFINDASSDNSVNILKTSGLKYISNERNMGYYKTIKKGIEYAYKNEYTYVIQFDSDRQHKAEEICKLINKIQEKKANLVIGSRYIERNNYKQKWIKKLGVLLSSKIVEKSFNKVITDATSGFRCLDRKVMKKIIDKGDNLKYLELNFIIELLKEEFEITEVSVKMEQRTYGNGSYQGVKKSWKYFIEMYKEVKKELKGENIKLL